MNKHNLTVGQIAKRSGLKVSTIHFYEQKKLITSTRTEGNQRRYSKDVLRRISVIKAAQKVGVSLQRIQEAFLLLPDNRTPTVNDWAALAKSWKNDLNAKIVQLEKLRDSLTHCIGCGCLSLKECPLYNQDDKLAKEGVGAVLLNID